MVQVAYVGPILLLGWVCFALSKTKDPTFTWLLFLTGVYCLGVLLNG